MSQTKPIYAGRFTLHLPTPIRGGFTAQKFNSLQLSWHPLHDPEAQPGADPWTSYVDRLRTEQGKDSGSTRIVKDYMLAGRHAVFYRFAPTDTSPYTLETWTVYGDQVLASSFDGSKNDLDKIEQATLDVLNHFILSSQDAAPGSAFYVEGGAIQLPPTYGEQIDAGWTLPENYGLDFSTVVYTTPARVDLVKKTKEAAVQSLTTPGSHFTLVRAGDRTVLGMVGQESVAHYRNDPSPTEFYTATFQFGGAPDKASRPGLKLSLTAYDRPGQKVDFKMFLATWESILKTMEVRLID